MALEYTLELVTKRTPAEVLRVLAVMPPGFEMRSGTLISPGVVVTAGDETALGRDIFKEAYEMDPSVYLKFRLDKFEGWEAGLSTTIKSSLKLVRTIGADGMLLFNGEIPVFMLVRGALTLNSAHDLWQQPEMLSLVSGAYESKPIAPL